ncbi:HAD hydrolase-like protein [Cohaesibacter sp. ES.047]|uniref:HAD hydrolase-like protein n=1 Tax=Cohaesibacter sp. ES.047 TaxID=1798205 RepID=UPI001FCF1865|nr:HAD hydrolase-like protein [Cohaesibacter sp. ES.047]
MRIKAIIFDMDGVLIEAKDWHYEALNRALLLFGYEISRFDHLTTYDGLPTRKKLEMLSAERNLPRSLHSFINEMKQITQRRSFTNAVALSLFMNTRCPHSRRKATSLVLPVIQFEAQLS